MRKFLESFAVLAIWLAIFPPTAPAAKYPQLISTQYDKQAVLPVEVHKPAITLEHVDRTKLPNGVKVSATARSATGQLWLLTDHGPFRSMARGYEPLIVGPRKLEPGQAEVRENAQITALVADRSGHIWVGTDKGVFISNGEDWWQKLDGHDGVPFEKINCLHLAPGGDVWAGTPEGAWRLRDGRFRYFWGRRWLPDNAVQAIWTDASGRAWIETKTGVACIEDRPATLAEKAAHYDRIIQERHNRRGYIAAIDLDRPGDGSNGAHFDVSDNDGLWTSLYVGAMAMRFAATKAPAAREQARKSMNALARPRTTLGHSWFPGARHGDRRRAESRRPRRSTPTSQVHAPARRPRPGIARRATPGLWCKGDTSSDELDGHLFRLVSLP